MANTRAELTIIQEMLPESADPVSAAEFCDVKTIATIAVAKTITAAIILNDFLINLPLMYPFSDFN